MNIVQRIPSGNFEVGYSTFLCLFIYSSYVVSDTIYRLLVLTVIQLGGLGLLFWAIGAILPVIIHTLMKGMLHWTSAGIIYSWIIQLGFVLILLSIRRFLVPVVLEWIENLPVFFSG